MKVKDIVNLLLEYDQEADVIIENERNNCLLEFRGVAELDDEVWIILE